jgi:protease-4
MDENTTPPPAYTPPPPPVVPAPPPVIVASAPSPMRKGGRGWMIVAVILFVLLAFSLLSNLGHFAKNFVSSGGKHIHSSGPRLEEVIIEDNEAATKIAVVDIEGIITSRVMDGSGYNLVDIVKAQLKRSEDDDGVKAVILKVDSPGGEVLASDEIYRLLTDFQKGAKKKPIVASMGNLAASGGYYVSSPCQWIVANEMTITGSIGVIMHGWNYRGLMDKIGLAPETYKSGKFKDMMSGERKPEEIPPEEREMMQHLIDETYARFKEVVQDGRSSAQQKNKGNTEKGRALADDWAKYADGRVLSGKEAFNLGFVDQLGNFQDAVKRAKILAGLGGNSSVNLIQFQQRYDLGDFLRMFGKSQTPPVVKVDLGFDAPKLQVGQLYFLAPTFAH